MKHFPGMLLCLVCLPLLGIRATGAETHAPHGLAVVLELEGKGLVSRAGSETWSAAVAGQSLLPGDRFRTLENSRAVVQMSDLSLIRLGALSLIRISEADRKRSGVQILRGLLYYFHRDKPGEFPVRTPTTYAVILGTEFAVAVDENDRTRFDLLDGRITLSNEVDRLVLTGGQAAVVDPGQAPRSTPALMPSAVLQWVLYYPGILDPDDLSFTQLERQQLASSFESYRQGDLRAALTAYPDGRLAASPEDRIYHASLLLAAGQVSAAESQLNEGVPGLETSAGRVAAALKQLIVTISGGDRSPAAGATNEGARLETGDPAGAAPGRRTTTAWMAESYRRQAQRDLRGALAAARQAATQSPRFGFALARVAELEFSHGRLGATEEALDQSLALAPRNAGAAALKGFVLAARNRFGSEPDPARADQIPDTAPSTDSAIAWFNRAIALDGALGPAWLGRGLCRIHRGDAERGRQDLEVAATLEPQRALFRSYLGKAFHNEGDHLRARREIGLAEILDPQDPTSWLYGALLNRDQNRLNEAVRDLQRSQELNDNRQLYRSGLLLDQDRAVRSVNLAGIYADVGLQDLAAREAGRAVEADPANYSAHLFLGDSYQRLRDPKRINQRYETPAITEYLLASLLSPAGAGTLAQSVTQSEYSKLFETDRVGLASDTEYFSRGDWLQSGAQFGTLGNFSYALSGYYRSENGQRANNSFEQSEVSIQVQQHLTPDDSVYLRVVRGDASGGDLAPRYDPAAANTNFNFSERQEPILLAGYHHQWQPGMHTLALASWLTDDLRVHDGAQEDLLVGRDNTGQITTNWLATVDEHYRTRVDLFTAEVQQIWQVENHAAILGARYHRGRFNTDYQQTNPIVPFSHPLDQFVEGLFPLGPTNVSTDFERVSGYVYYHWRPLDPLLLVAGLSYDVVTYPANFRFAPIQSGQDTRRQLGPKGGIVWSPSQRITVRGGFSQSLGGAGFEQSVRLEPTQVAGFNQAFRSIMPEAITGANSGAPFEAWDLAFEQRLESGTTLMLGGEWLRSRLQRDVGVFNLSAVGFPTVTRGATLEELDYEEQTVSVSVHQRLAEDWAFGVRYQLNHADLQHRYLTIPTAARPPDNTEAVLHQVNLYGIYQHPSGFFAQAEALWNGQSSQGYGGALPGDEFWQFNVYAGYRFPRRQAEIRAGLLNLTDQDYRLNPLNLHPDLPRDRTLTVSLRWFF